jgi:hypothetical protein
MAKKNETVDLNVFAGFMGLANTLSRAKKRSLPRGWIKPVTWNTQFKIVENHIEDWGYEVELRPGTHDRVELGESKTVYVNSSCHPETRFYTLLHEVGHIIIRKRWKKFSAAHPRYLDHPDHGMDSRRERSKAYLIGLLAEEIEAWAQGLKFARRLGLFVDMYKFDNDKNSALMTYVDWVAEITTTQKKAGRIAAKNRKTPSRKAKT